MAFPPSRRLFVAWVLGGRFHPLCWSMMNDIWLEKETKKTKNCQSRTWTIQSLWSKVSKHAQWTQDDEAFKRLTCYVPFSSCRHETGKRDSATAKTCHLQLAKALWNNTLADDFLKDYQLDFKGFAWISMPDTNFELAWTWLKRMVKPNWPTVGPMSSPQCF